LLVVLSNTTCTKVNTLSLLNPFLVLVDKVIDKWKK